MSTTGTFHLIFCGGAIVLGAVVLALPKGTRWHRAWGHGYFWCMVGVVGTSFAMYGLTGRVTPFHLAALIAGVTVVNGMLTVLRRQPKGYWIGAHATWMAWSYVGLLAALVAESLTRFIMPALAETLEQNALWPIFWILVAVGSLGTMWIGALQIRKRLPAAVRSTPAAMRIEREQLRERARG
jgi:uncharacterized membrane protein